MNEFDCTLNTEEVVVFPLTNIPVETEDTPIHDGINPCGDPTCYCAFYGYETEVQG